MSEELKPIAQVRKLAFETTRDGITTVSFVWGVAPYGEDVNSYFPEANPGDLAIAIDEEGFPTWFGKGDDGSWAGGSAGSGEMQPQAMIKIIDSLSDTTVLMGVHGMKLHFSFPEYMISGQINMGGVDIDEGNSPNIFLNGSGLYEASAGASGYGSAGYVTLQYTDGNDQWFVIPSVMPDSAPFVSLGLGLTTEAIVEGNAPSGKALWPGTGTGGSVICGYFLPSEGGLYTWTTSSDALDHPGQATIVANYGISSIDQRKLSAARRSSDETGSVSYSEMRVGVNADGKAAIEWYLPQVAIDDEALGLADGQTEGWKPLWTSTGSIPAGQTLRLRVAYRMAGAQLGSTPYMMGVPSLDQKWAAAGYRHYIVKGISDADLADAFDVLANNGATGAARYVVVRYSDYKTFDGSEEYSEELTYLESVVVANGPLFALFDVDNADAMLEASRLISTLTGFRLKVCDEMKELIRAYYVIRMSAGMSMDDVKIAVGFLDNVISALDNGMLQLAYTEIGLVDANDDTNITPVLKSLILDTLSKGLRKYATGS